MVRTCISSHLLIVWSSLNLHANRWYWTNKCWYVGWTCTHCRFAPSQIASCWSRQMQLNNLPVYKMWQCNGFRCSTTPILERKLQPGIKSGLDGKRLDGSRFKIQIGNEKACQPRLELRGCKIDFGVRIFFLLLRQTKQILLPEISRATLGETGVAILAGTFVHHGKQFLADGKSNGSSPGHIWKPGTRRGQSLRL